MFKKLIGFCLVFMLFCGNGQLLYAFENNSPDDSSKTFIGDVKQSINGLSFHMRSVGEGVREGSELFYGLVVGTTITVGPDEEHKNLKDAVEHSKSGDTLLLVQGNYTGMNNTNISIDHDLKIKALVPFKSWMTYNNTDYSHEEFNKLIDMDNSTSSDIENNSVEHQENATILNGNGSAQIFNVLSNSSLELNGLFLINGTDLKGGAINNKGNLKINDSYFINNQVFDDNVRDQEKGGGGAIYNEGTLDLVLTDFKGNDANDYSKGGAIYNNGTINSLNNCTFNSNYAHDGGGAIYNTKKINSLNNNIFSLNSADSTTSHGGGAILDEGSDILNFKGTSFLFNIANDAGGGAIDSYSSGINFENSTLLFNQAKTDGGSMRLLNGQLLNINKSTLNFNKAESEGGSLFYNGENLNIYDSEFDGNVAEDNGGGLYLESCTNSGLFNNNFISNVGNDGGAIYHKKGLLDLNNNTFTFNNANQTTSNGGTVFTTGGVFNINNNTFDRNYAMGDGGAIYNLNSKGLIKDTILHENICNNNGGALYNNNYNTSINNCSIDSNYAIGNGGAIYNGEGGTNFLANHTLFANNTANKDGGSIYNVADSFYTYFSAFGSNKAVGGNGGALYTDGNNVVIELNDFKSNFAEEDGGGIFNNGETIRVSQVNLTNNAAHGYGGGYYDKKDVIDAKNMNFQGNAAGKSGDDYYTDSKKTANIAGCMTGLVVALIILTLLSILVPEALEATITAAVESITNIAAAVTVANVGFEIFCIGASVGIFMGVEDAVSKACPEFEEWSSKYWYIVTIVFVLTGVFTSLTAGLVSCVREAYAAMLKIGPWSFRLIVLQTKELIKTAFRGIFDRSKIIITITRVLFQILHVDDWIVGIIMGIKGATSNSDKSTD